MQIRTSRRLCTQPFHEFYFPRHHMRAVLEFQAADLSTSPPVDNMFLPAVSNMNIQARFLSRVLSKSQHCRSVCHDCGEVDPAWGMYPISRRAVVGVRLPRAAVCGEGYTTTSIARSREITELSLQPSRSLRPTLQSVDCHCNQLNHPSSKPE
jgi:hypothetical protein